MRPLAVPLLVIALVTSACAGTATDDTASNPEDDGAALAVEPALGHTDSADDLADSAGDAAADHDATAEESADGPRYDFSGVDAIIAEFVEQRSLDGAGFVVVHRDHGIIHHEHWGAFEEDRISLFASSTKMVTAGVLFHLDDQGLLDIDAPVADVVEWGSGNPEITTAQLLSNSSGLVGLFPDPAYGPYLCQWISSTTLQDCAESIMTTTADDEQVVAPDTEFRYGGGQWQVAGAVAEVVSGKSWYELIDEIYVEPCGLEVLDYNSHFDQIEGAGFSHPPGFRSDPGQMVESANPNMEAGLYSDTTDYARLLLMHLRGGRCGETRVLSVEALARMHGDRIGAVYGGDAFGANLGYGMGWWVYRDTGYIQDGGAYGSVPWLDLEDGYGALLLTESDNGTANQLVAEIIDLVDTAVTAGT